MPLKKKFIQFCFLTFFDFIEENPPIISLFLLLPMATNEGGVFNHQPTTNPRLPVSPPYYFLFVVINYYNSQIQSQPHTHWKVRFHSVLISSSPSLGLFTSITRLDSNLTYTNTNKYNNNKCVSLIVKNIHHGLNFKYSNSIVYIKKFYYFFYFEN